MFGEAVNNKNSFNDGDDLGIVSEIPLNLRRIEEMVRGNIKKEPKKPSFVEAQKMIFNFWNAKLSVQLLKGYGEDPDPPYVLSIHRSFINDEGKWNDQSVKITKVVDWEEIKKVIDNNYSLRLNWISEEEALTKLEEDTSKITVKEVVDKRPTLATEILENINLEKFDSTQLSDFLNKISERDRDAITLEINLFEEIIKSLNPRDTKSIDNFLEILDKVSIHGVNTTMQFVLGRLEKIKIFEELINNDKTYEIKGENSIHKFLERNIWILNEKYEILASNKALKVEIGKNYKAKHRSSKRPDFVLKASDSELVIAEIKKPKYEIKNNDLIQIMDYKSLANKLSGINYSYDGYLIGKHFSDEVKAFGEDMSKMGIYLKSYSDIVSDVNMRYKRLLEILEEEMREE